MSVKSKKVVIVHECYSKHNSNLFSFFLFKLLIRSFYECTQMKSNNFKSVCYDANVVAHILSTKIFCNVTTFIHIISSHTFNYGMERNHKNNHDINTSDFVRTISCTYTLFFTITSFKQQRL